MFANHEAIGSKRGARTASAGLAVAGVLSGCAALPGGANNSLGEQFHNPRNFAVVETTRLDDGPWMALLSGCVVARTGSIENAYTLGTGFAVASDGKTYLTDRYHVTNKGRYSQLQAVDAEAAAGGHVGGLYRGETFRTNGAADLVCAITVNLDESGLVFARPDGTQVYPQPGQVVAESGPTSFTVLAGPQEPVPTVAPTPSSFQPSN